MSFYGFHQEHVSPDADVSSAGSWEHHFFRPAVYRAHHCFSFSHAALFPNQSTTWEQQRFVRWYSHTPQDIHINLDKSENTYWLIWLHSSVGLLYTLRHRRAKIFLLEWRCSPKWIRLKTLFLCCSVDYKTDVFKNDDAHLVICFELYPSQLCATMLCLPFTLPKIMLLKIRVPL